MRARLATLAGYAHAWAVVSLQSEMKRFGSRGRSDRVRWRTDYRGQPILLVALFQKGDLRDDTLSLLDAAKAEGFYVIAVNSLALEDGGARHEARIDLYIERYNFGRDFGSYASGVRLILGDAALRKTPRLILMNDSVFVCRTRIAAFLRELRDSPHEVSGATENFEIEHHIGSFCVAMSNRVLTHPAHVRYWRRYRSSDVRPTVIRRGEMGLSRALRRAVSSPGRMRPLYDVARFREAMAGLPGLQEAAVEMARKSDLTGWRRLVLSDVVAEYIALYRRSEVEPARVSIEAAELHGGLLARYPMVTIRDALAYLAEIGPTGREGNTSGLSDHFLGELKAAAAASFVSGSQIHQNAAILLRLGLPIVKLDGLYRGMFGFSDVNRILALLDPDDARALARLLFQRPFGGDVLTGWKRRAFFVGLI